MRLVLGLVAFACACGSSGGRPGTDMNKKLVDLSASEVTDLCQWEAAVTNGPRSVVCSPQITVNFKSEAQCEAAQVPASCAATVGQTEDCIEALDADPCSFGGNACAALDACGTVSGRELH